MRASNLTTRFVESIAPPATGQASYYDIKVRGLCLRVTPTGRRVWNLTFRVHGRSRRLTFAQPFPILSIADARKLATEKLRAVGLGEDPAADKHGRDSFADLAALYLEKWARPRKRSAKEDERILRVDVLPKWGARKATDIQRRDVRVLIEGVAGRGSPIQANRTLACISAIFSYAVREEIVAASPAYKVTGPGVERARERILADHEIRALWNATEVLPVEPAAIFKLGLLLGQRRGEITGMQWSEIDLEGGWFNLPGARSKNGRSNRIPILGTALELLRGLRAQAETSEFVFPGAQKHPRRFEWQLESLKRATGVLDFTFHDLRRTATSLLASLRIERTVVKKLLNHSEGKDVTGAVYDRYSYEVEKRQALAALDRRIQQIVSGDPAASKVVELHA